MIRLRGRRDILLRSLTLRIYIRSLLYLGY